MISTGFEATLSVSIAIIPLRFVSLFIINEVIRLTLRQDNSITSIRKIRRASSLFERITRICFWSAKTSKRIVLRLMICMKIFGVFTILLPLIFVIPIGFNEDLDPLATFVLWCAFIFDEIVCFPIAIYALTLYGKCRKHTN